MFPKIILNVTKTVKENKCNKIKFFLLYISMKRSLKIFYYKGSNYNRAKFANI